MSGYNGIEQAIGGLLDRFPRMKDAVETVYQRACYNLLADSEFEYEVHKEVTLERIDEAFGIEHMGECFVGFYDICPWNESMDQFLIHELCDEDLAIVVLEEGTKREVAITSAWNYQQGSRAQWHPTQKDAVVFNDLENGDPVMRVVTVDGKEIDRYEGHLQAMNPTGGDFLVVDYRRYDQNSPAYGYGQQGTESLSDPVNDGIIKVNTDGGREVIVPFTTLRSAVGGSVPQEHHYIHHTLYAPGGERFVFLHRWREGGRRRTRLCVSDLAGNVREVIAHDSISHFSWLDGSRLFLWGGSPEYGLGYHVVNVETCEIEYVGTLQGFSDGHPSVSPCSEWVVTDTYPDRTRTRSLWLHHIESGRIIRIGEFFSPFDFDASTRCDLHPRWSPDGEKVAVDSSHEGVRTCYLLSIQKTVNYQ